MTVEVSKRGVVLPGDVEDWLIRWRETSDSMRWTLGDVIKDLMGQLPAGGSDEERTYRQRALLRHVGKLTDRAVQTLYGYWRTAEAWDIEHRAGYSVLPFSAFRFAAMNIEDMDGRRLFMEVVLSYFESTGTMPGVEEYKSLCKRHIHTDFPPVDDDTESSAADSHLNRDDELRVECMRLDILLSQMQKTAIRIATLGDAEFALLISSLLSPLVTEVSRRMDKHHKSLI